MSRLNEGLATDLRPGTRVLYELGMDRTGKMAASSLRIAPPELNHGPLTRAELHARLDDWLAALPQSHTPVEIAGKMAGDAA